MTTTERLLIICLGCLGHSVTCLEHAVPEAPTADCPGCVGHSQACLDGAPMTPENVSASAQYWGAAHSQGGLAIELPGDAHSAERIMFVHGVMTGHGACTCPVVDEQGQNVNPGRAPLERKAAGRAEGSRKASETYARRRARKCADVLALIEPSLWDDETRRIVTTLGTMAAPSRINDVLADEMPVTLDELDRMVARLDAEGGTWDDMPDGTEDIREAMLAEITRITGLCTAVSPLTDTPCVLQAGHTGQHAMHTDQETHDA